MKNNNSDIFEGLKKDKSLVRIQSQSDNFFLLEDVPLVNNEFRLQRDANRRLNDYDTNLLKEDAYKDVRDDLFKLEYKISKIEAELKAIEAQIQAASDIQDYTLWENLQDRKQILQEDLEALVAIYNDKSLSARITESISGLLGTKIKTNIKDFQSKISKYSEIFLSKLPQRFSSVIELKKSLSKLENINKSVDELMSLNVTYGENLDKYEQLSRFIIRANSIQSEISHYLKEK